MNNDVSVIVPAATGLMTPYVLQEQHDWFEDEIKFLRTCMKPGMRVIDVGANYGLYTLSIAKLIGVNGRICAFEPTEQTANCLRSSIAENQFTNIELVQAGLSNKTGQAELYTCDNSELNSLSQEVSQATASETISLLTLDQCYQEYQWQNIDFIKLDAEGEELNILEAGKLFLEHESPLIMFEIKQDVEINHALLEAFTKQNYNLYRLIPGLNILIPFSQNEPVDNYLLNLFACKQDTEARLESSGFLVKDIQDHHAAIDTDVIGHNLNDFPYWKKLEGQINLTTSTASLYKEIFSLFLLARSNSFPVDERLALLFKAMRQIHHYLETGEQRPEHLTTISRIAFFAGERALGVDILSFLIDKYINDVSFDITDPFLPACPRYDRLDPNDDMNGWLLSSILEQCVIMHAFSTYMSKRRIYPLLERLEQTGFMGEDMQRRKQMIDTYFPL